MENKLDRYHFAVIDSTNTWAKKNIHLFDPLKLSLVTAFEQTAGRGRYDHTWKSPPGQNIYASFCFVIPKESQALSNLAQIMALSAVEALESMGFKGQLKWPNDLLLSGKKIGGILCEIENMPNKTWAILGIGININMPAELLQTIDQPATSLLVESGTSYEVEALTQKLQELFTTNLETLLKKGFSPFLSDYREKLIHSQNDLLNFKEGAHEWKGFFHSINEDGTLNLELESGEVKTFFSGELI